LPTISLTNSFADRVKAGAKKVVYRDKAAPLMLIVTTTGAKTWYPTMDLESICALPVKDLAFEDSILFLWATAPKLAESLKVVEAWGFNYRTSMIWAKDKIGMGYFARNQHEQLLVATRGKIPAPDANVRYSSIINAPRGAHSEKPDEFYEIIESQYPDLAKIELFARNPRDGWARWGNQADAA
jgi:N6-adenosine-specific RNA methylase IME4